MSLPTYQDMMSPLLAAISDGEDHNMADLTDQLAQHLNISEEDRAIMNRNASEPLYRNRARWTRTYLKQAGAVTSPLRGVVRITTRGQGLLEQYPTGLNTQVLLQFPEFERYFKGIKTPEAPTATDDATDVHQAHEPALALLEEAVNTNAPVWWVNQGFSYKDERQEGCVRAPLTNKAGVALQHHVNVSLLKPGDVIIHYANSAIRAVSKVKDPAHPQNADEYIAWTEYEDFEVPVELQRIPVALRTPAAGPFTQDGAVKQVYLVPVDPTFVRQMMKRLVGTDVVPVATYDEIRQAMSDIGLRIPDQTLRRYHLSLRTRNFVILAGISGSGKTWLSEAYAKAVGAKHLLVSVAPNWTTNEDLLGYLNPINAAYYHTDFSRFLHEADAERKAALAEERTPKAYHVTLDEMNLARVEYYFAKFLSAMEVRARDGVAPIELAPGSSVTIGSNLFVIGTVNVDETTHSFADKVFDRTQLIELDVPRAELAVHLGDKPYRDSLLRIWDVLRYVAPFAYRILDEVAAYIAAGEELAVPWETALDEQVLQKLLPKIKGADPRVGECLARLTQPGPDGEPAPVVPTAFPLSFAKAEVMREAYIRHGFVSFF